MLDGAKRAKTHAHQLFCFDNSYPFAMPTLHIFNPWHDEALAASTPFYTPTRAARTLERDLATLPAWWANEGDYVLLPDDAGLHTELLPAHVQYICAGERERLSALRFARVEPWGWDALLVRRLQRLGIDPALLPTNEELQGIRWRSSRQTACQLLPMLCQRVEHTVGESAWCTTTEEVEASVERYGTAILKAPWSCSGRGVFRAQHPMSEALLQRAKRLLREQGAVEAEPYYQRKADLALEFCMADTLHYEGLSVFRSTPTGGYGGNVLLPQEELWLLLPTHLRATLAAVRTAIAEVLPPLLKEHYRGPLGIDMMVVETAEGLRLHPCVELNLRNTMGRVACLLEKRLHPKHGSHYMLLPTAETANRHIELTLTPGAKDIQAVIAYDE